MRAYIYIYTFINFFVVDVDVCVYIYMDIHIVWWGCKQKIGVAVHVWKQQLMTNINDMHPRVWLPFWSMCTIRESPSLVSFGWHTSRQFECTMGVRCTSKRTRSYPRCEPWRWNIYLQNWVIFGVNLGPYSSTMVLIWVWLRCLYHQLVGLREKLQATPMIFMGKSGWFPVKIVH